MFPAKKQMDKQTEKQTKSSSQDFHFTGSKKYLIAWRYLFISLYLHHVLI